jgi:hypothetical protein
LCKIYFFSIQATDFEKNPESLIFSPSCFRLQYIPDSPDCLVGSHIVFNEGKPYEFVPEFPETQTRRYRHPGFPDHELGKFDGTHMAVFFRDSRPDEHGASGTGDIPTRPVQAGYEGISPAFIGLSDFFHAILGSV